jgi:hypothetical protein
MSPTLQSAGLDEGAIVTEPSTATKVKRQPAKSTAATVEDSHDQYVLPLVGVRIPATLVNAGFWGSLIGAVALGAIDPPLGVLVGAGVVVGRHTARK